MVPDNKNIQLLLVRLYMRRKKKKSQIRTFFLNPVEASILKSPQQTFVLVKRYWRHLQDVFKTSSRHNCKTSYKLVLKTSWGRFRKTYCKYVLRTSWRGLGRRKVLRWRRLGKQEMFAGIVRKSDNEFYC